MGSVPSWSIHSTPSKVIPKSRPNLQLYCYKSHRVVTIPYTWMHVAGSPCTDHSMFGSRMQFAGKNAKVFYVWVSLMRRLRPKCILHENVTKFGKAELCDMFQDLYYILYMIGDPRTLGWASTRKRQCCILILRTFLDPVLENTAYQQNPYGVFDFEDTFPVQEIFDAIFQRTCNFTFGDYFCASDAELEKEKKWAAERSSVKHFRAAGIADGTDPYKDKPGSCAACLTFTERARVKKYARRWPAEIWDLGQDPDERPMHSDSGRLHTTIRGCGIQFCMPKRCTGGRWLTAGDQWVSMGFPVLMSHVGACGGAICQFTRPSAYTDLLGISLGPTAVLPRTCPSFRTRRSQTVQCGNSMHINFIGAALLLVAICFPCGEPCENWASPAPTADMSDDKRRVKRRAGSASGGVAGLFAAAVDNKRRRLQRAQDAV